MIYYRHKLWFKDGKALIDVRDYEVSDALRRKKDILIVLEEDGKMVGKMTLTVAQLKKKRLIRDKQTVASKIYPGQHYTILSYDWVPDKKLTEEEQFYKYH